MSIKIGDSVFVRTGEPGLVRKRDALTGSLTLEGDLKAVQKEMRHGYLNGLTPAEREELNGILDEAKEATAPDERIERLKARLDEVSEDPRNHVLTRYLRAELTHLMNTHGVRPREYHVHETKTR